MTSELGSVFRELGLAQYLDTFVEQGFDTWDTILDIQESDLDALGVKLGHRRKLQRRIANARGVAPGTSLASHVKAASDDGRGDIQRPEGSRDGSNETGGTMKRKYRRHPKPDENAPERPPSAYVLFSNKMREDLKSQNLTFTEIAKLVGENWQNLAPTEKEAYESQANAAKEKYHRDLVEYKKTSEYRKYAQYLQDFKEKQAKQNQAHEAAKRTKAEPARLRHGSSSSSANLSGMNSSGGRSTSASGSGSERLQGSEPPPTRRERMNSTASLNDLHHPGPMATSLMLQQPGDDPRRSPKIPYDGLRDRHGRRTRHGHAWQEKTSLRTDVPQRNLPSLSDMLDDGRMGAPHTSSESSPYSAGFAAAHRNGPDVPSVLPRGLAPTFQHEQSTGSNASLSSAASYGRQSEGPVPIHALLTNRPAAVAGSSHYDSGSPTSISGVTSPVDHGKPSPLGQSIRGYGFESAPSAFEHMRIDRSTDGDVVMSNTESVHSSPVTRQHRSKDSFDGMNALLQAGEIVGRRN